MREMRPMMVMLLFFRIPCSSRWLLALIIFPLAFIDLFPGFTPTAFFLSLVCRIQRYDTCVTSYPQVSVALNHHHS